MVERLRLFPKRALLGGMGSTGAAQVISKNYGVCLRGCRSSALSLR